MTGRDDFSVSCPMPTGDGATIQLAHGGGGRAMEQLLDTVIRPAFADPELDLRRDAATVSIDGPVAFTTDSYVVQPIFFPGGDIGTLAVNGTVNDLAMSGARPLYLSVGFILEEGLPLESLRRVVASMREAAVSVGVRLVTGDTKVVDRGKADGIFVSTAGIGRIIAPAPIGPACVRPGDAVILSGDIGRHGMAIMAARERFGFDTVIESDCAPLWDPVSALIEAGVDLHCLRDLTRGGLASALVEIAETGNVAIDIDETIVPVSPPVTAACELLGLDPLHVANEGRFVAFVARDQADRALNALHGFGTTADAVVIGEVGDNPPGTVSCRGALGVTRALDMLSGAQLPRIC